MFVVLIRTVVLYLFIVFGIRLLGKRQVGELEPAELTLALIIADLASVPMQDNGIPLLAGLIPIVVLLCIATILSVLSARFIRFRSLLCGRPSLVIQNGMVLEKELRKNRLTVDELMEELRMQGCPDFRDVKFAVLETNGMLSVIPYTAQRPVTPAQLGMAPEEPGLSVILISDGRVLGNNLKMRGYEEGWLLKQLNSYGLKSPRQAFLMTVDETGQTYCIPKEGCR